MALVTVDEDDTEGVGAFLTVEEGGLVLFVGPREGRLTGAFPVKIELPTLVEPSCGPPMERRAVLLGCMEGGVGAIDIRLFVGGAILRRGRDVIVDRGHLTGDFGILVF